MLLVLGRECVAENMTDASVQPLCVNHKRNGAARSIGIEATKMMDPKYDPYYLWLGIPPEEQPANYYRLLVFE